MGLYDTLFVRYNDILELIGEAKAVLEKSQQKSIKTGARFVFIILLFSYFYFLLFFFCV